MQIVEDGEGCKPGGLPLPDLGYLLLSVCALSFSLRLGLSLL